jgi:HNH/Endo VII superfamily nuclease toxins
MTMNISQEKSNQSLQWTSLNDPKLMQQFVEKFNGLLQVKPEKRNDALRKIINQILGATETPSIDEITQGNFAQNGSGNQATFDSEKWKININSSRISQLNSSNAGKLARLIYHEMRHAEQSYHIAQWLASPPNSKSFKDIQKITDGDIKDSVIRQAIKSAHNYPTLSTNQKQQIAQAEYWYDSLYGKNIQNSQGKYIKGPRVIVDHTSDPKNKKHFHAGQPKGDSGNKLYDFRKERYAPVGGSHHYCYN